MPCFTCIGYAISNNESFEKFIRRKYFKWIFISCLLGIVDYILDSIIGTKAFWSNWLGFTAYMTDIKHQSGRLVYGLPGNFYGYGNGGYFSSKRLVGLWGGPLTCAYALIIPTFYYFLQFYNNLKDKIKLIRNGFILIFLIYTIWLTHTRAIIILVAICCIGYIFLYAKRNVPLFFASICLLLVGMFFLNSNEVFKFLYDGSTAGHILSVSNAIGKIKISLFGEGINYAGIEGTATATESTYLTLLGNVGIIGLFFFISLIVIPLKSILRSKDCRTELNFSKTLYLSGVVLLITGVLSEQLLAYTTVAPFYIMLGHEYKKSTRSNFRSLKRSSNYENRN